MSTTHEQNQNHDEDLENTEVEQEKIYRKMTKVVQVDENLTGVWIVHYGNRAKGSAVSNPNPSSSTPLACPKAIPNQFHTHFAPPNTLTSIF